MKHLNNFIYYTLNNFKLLLEIILKTNIVFIYLGL